MGVDYSATSGYGFAIAEEDLADVAERVGYVNPYAEDDDGWIDAYDLGDFLTKDTSLAYEHVGNLMGGDDIYLIIIASSTAHSVDWRYDFGLKRFGDLEISEREQQDLDKVHELVYGEGASGDDDCIGWMLAMTVS